MDSLSNFADSIAAVAPIALGALIVIAVVIRLIRSVARRRRSGA